MPIKITKDDLETILKKISNQTSMDDVQSTVDEICDEYNIDLTEPEEIDEPEIVDDEDPIGDDLDDYDEDEDEAAWKF